jgi:hypothetical protein
MLLQLIKSGRLILKKTKSGFVIIMLDGKLQCELYYKQHGFNSSLDFIKFYNQHTNSPI